MLKKGSFNSCSFPLKDEWVPMCWNRLGWWRIQASLKQSCWSICGGHIFVRTRSVSSQSTEKMPYHVKQPHARTYFDPAWHFLVSKLAYFVFLGRPRNQWGICLPHLGSLVLHLVCLCRTWAGTDWAREDQLSWTSSRWNPAHKSQLWTWKCFPCFIANRSTHHDFFSAVFFAAKFLMVETNPLLVITSSSSWT